MIWIALIFILIGVLAGFSKDRNIEPLFIFFTSVGTTLLLVWIFK